MKRSDWQYRKQIEQRVAEALASLARVTQKIADKSTSVEELQRKIQSLYDTPQWKTLSWNEAIKMTHGISKANGQTWKEASTKYRQGSKIHKALRDEISNNEGFLAIVRANAKVFRSMPIGIAEEITKRASIRFIDGLRASDVLREIQAAVPGMTITKAQLIARTETAKTQAAVTQIRSESLGIDWYVWRTSEDQRVRSSHKHMEGVYCRFSQPPDPETLIGMKNQFGHYNPGEVPNCRCYAEPVIDWNFAKFPIKAYSGGTIKRLPKSQVLIHS